MILLDESDTGGPSSITVTMKNIFPLQFGYCELSVGNQ